MKRHRMLIWLIGAAVLFASVFPAYAIGFTAEETYESVVIIRSGNALGSGFALGSNCIVTNAHVIQDSRDVTVQSYGGEEYRAYVLGMDEDQDIAVLAVPGADFPVLKVADPDAARTGDDVYAIGAPKNMTYTLTKGVISARERKIGFYSYIQTDAPINEGNSGGPLLNAAGEVLGMNTFKITDSEGIGLAIPITRICSFVTGLGVRLDDGGNVSGPVGPTEAPEEPGNQPQWEPTEGENPEEPTVQEPSGGSLLPWILAGASGVLNVILLILLLFEKHRNLRVVSDPRERTDFEIDIWE